MSARELITEHLDLWTGAITKKSTSGRGSSGKIELTGLKKLRELILELAVRGKLIEQDSSDESASALLDKVRGIEKELAKSKLIRKPKPLPDVAADEAEFTLPSSWRWVRLGTIGQIVGGGTPKSGEPSYWSDKDIPWLTPADLYGLKDKYIASGNRDISKLGLEKSSAQLLPVGSVLFSSRAPIGYVAITTAELATNQGFKSCTPYIREMNQFIYYFLKRSARYIDASASGTTFKEVSGAKVASIPMPLPPLAEQHRIVQKVDELMALCDRLEQQTSGQLEAHETLVDTLLGTLTQSENATELADNWARLSAHFDTLFTTEQSIDKLKQNILQLAVMGRLVEQDARDEPAQTLLKCTSEEKHQMFSKGVIKKPKIHAPIDDSEKLFRLPSGWAWARLDDTFINIVDCPHSTPKFIDQGKLCLDTNSFKGGKLNPSKFRYVSDDTFEQRNTRLQPQPNDIVFAREGSVGESVVIPSHIECCLGQRVMLFRPASYAEPNFLRLTLSNPLALNTLLSLHKGIGAKHVNVSDMRKYVIAVPPAEEQHRIIKKVDELTALCDQLKERLAHASETRCHLAEAVVREAVA